MAKSAELLALKLVDYRRDDVSMVYIRDDKGEEHLVECDCGNKSNWLIPPGPKEGLTLICNLCFATYVYLLHPKG